MEYLGDFSTWLEPSELLPHALRVTLETFHLLIASNMVPLMSRENTMDTSMLMVWSLHLRT